MTLSGHARAALYDALIVRMTRAWYRAVLTRLPPGTRVLDVGMGTGSALLANADLVVARDLHVTGVDVDAAYVARCRRAVRRLGLDDRIEPRLESVYAHRGGPYAAAYWSGSFMLLPDPPAALRHVAALLVPGGTMYFTQTVEHARSPLLERLKPLLRLVTTVDFGRVTYEPEFRRALAAGGVQLDDVEVLRGGRGRSAILAVARVAAAARPVTASPPAVPR